METLCPPTANERHGTINWSDCGSAVLSQYSQLLDDLLRQVNAPQSILTCTAICNELEHHNFIDKYYIDVISYMQQAINVLPRGNPITGVGIMYQVGMIMYETNMTWPGMRTETGS